MSSSSSSFYPIIFDTFKEYTPNTAFWYPASHLIKDKSPPNRSSYWQGCERKFWRLDYYLPPKAQRTPTGPRDAVLGGAPHLPNGTHTLLGVQA